MYHNRFAASYSNLAAGADIEEEDVRGEITRHIQSATMQPVDTFFNSIRQRLSAAARSNAGGGRPPSGGLGSFVSGNLFKPRVLIALLNIFRVHYNFFEARPYAQAGEKQKTKGKEYKAKIPGTNEYIYVQRRIKKRPVLRTPAMRAGIYRKSSIPPDIRRILYHEWELRGTDLERSFKTLRSKNS